MNTIRRLIHAEMFMAVVFVTLGFLALFAFFDFVDQLPHALLADRGAPRELGEARALEGEIGNHRSVRRLQPRVAPLGEYRQHASLEVLGDFGERLADIGPAESLEVPLADLALCHGGGVYASFAD